MSARRIAQGTNQPLPSVRSAGHLLKKKLGRANARSEGQRDLRFSVISASTEGLAQGSVQRLANIQGHEISREQEAVAQGKSVSAQPVIGIGANLVAQKPGP